MSTHDSNITIPPNHMDAEEALLGSILIHPDAIVQIPPRLQGNHFYQQRLGYIYDSTLELHRQRQPIDFLTLTAELERKGQLEDVGGASAVAGLVNVVPSALHAPAYAELILEAAQARQLIQMLGKTVARLYANGEASSDIVADLERELLNMHHADANTAPRHIADIGQEVMTELEAAARGECTALFSTGYDDIDHILGGFRKGDLLLLGARPAMGKTSLLLNFAANAARQGQSSLIFSLEMSEDTLHRRLLTAHTGVSMLSLNSGRVHTNDWPQLKKAAADIAEAPIWVDDTPSIAISDVRAKATQITMSHGIDFILLDYAQLATTRQPGLKRYQEVGEVAKGLKALAKELKVPVLAASQISREVDRRADKRPTLSDLRESGDLEQHADVVMFIHRDKESQGWCDADIIIAKHRNGPLGTAKLLWQPDWVRFVAMAPASLGA